MPCTFSDFPNEILLIIGKHLTAGDLHSLVRVSHHFSSLFLSHFRSLALKEENNHTAIYWAAASGNRVMLKRILEEGENVIVFVNAKMVHRSPRVCSEWLLAWMLNGKPNIFLGEPWPTRGLWTAISWAVWTNHQALLRLLLDRGKFEPHSLFPALESAVTCGNEKAVELLLDWVLKDNPYPQKVFSKLLMTATFNNRINMVKRLIKEGANINATSRFYPRREPLFRIAEEKGYMELAGLLVEQHIREDVNFFEPVGKRSALYLAVQFSNEALVRHVLKCGIFVSIESQDRLGNTPSQIAAQKGNKAIIELLASHSRVGKCKSLPYML